MNGNKYGAESCTIVPIMLILPQLAGRTSVSLDDVNAWGKIAEKFVTEFITESNGILFDCSPFTTLEIASSATGKIKMYLIM